MEKDEAGTARGTVVHERMTTPSEQDLGERARGVVSAFPQTTEWEKRYRHLILLGRELPEIPEAEKGDRFLIEGCVSRAWLIPSRDGKLVRFRADSEAAIVKGILALLLAVYSGARPEEILAFEPQYLEELGINEHLSMNRRNGLSQVLKQIKLYATVFRAQDLAGSQTSIRTST